MKYKELENKGKPDLWALLVNLKKEMFNLRLQAAALSKINTARQRECRRDVARIKTKLKQMA